MRVDYRLRLGWGYMFYFNLSFLCDQDLLRKSERRLGEGWVQAKIGFGLHVLV